MISHYDIQWTPTIGDPTLIGWLTVLCYLICSLQCLHVYRNSLLIFSSHTQRQQLLWLALTILTLFLCINKQLDLQTLLTQIAKHYTYEYDVYKYRRLYQKIFIISIVIATIVSLAALIFIYRGVVKQNIVSISGLCVLATFILMRASIFHSVDVLVDEKMFDTQFNWLLELLGVMLISINAHKLSKTIKIQKML